MPQKGDKNKKKVCTAPQKNPDHKYLVECTFYIQRTMQQTAQHIAVSSLPVATEANPGDNLVARPNRQEERVPGPE